MNCRACPAATANFVKVGMHQIVFPRFGCTVREIGVSHTTIFVYGRDGTHVLYNVTVQCIVLPLINLGVRRAL